MEKLLLYIDSMTRGGAQRVMNVLAHYFSQKYEIILVNDFPLEPEEPQYEVAVSIRREYLQDSNSGNAIIKNIKRIHKLRKLVQLYKPDLVLSFMGKTNYRMLISTIGLPVAKTCSVRNDPNREYGATFTRKMIANVIIGLADGIVFQTHDAMCYFNKRIQARSQIILNPIDDVFFKEYAEQERKDIVTMGRLENQKNHAMLIRAFNTIKDEYPKTNLYIYGEGPLRATLEKIILELDLTQRVFLPGNTSDVCSKLINAKLFVLSSDYEGLPNALMEAMAVGTPVVSTDCPCGGPKELFGEELKEVLVPCSSVENLSTMMKRMLNDDNKRKTVGKKAKEIAKQFQIGDVCFKWEEFLSEIVDKD